MEFDPLPERADGPPSDAADRGGTPWWRRRRVLLWAIPVAAALVAAVTGVAVAASIHMPEVERALDDFVPRLVTHLYDKNGEVFRSYSRENRVLLDEGDVPKLLQNAIVAAEDSSFFVHGGVDLKGIARAAYKNVLAGRKKEGASTITMQLARELFLHRKKTWKRKIEEAFLAVELEKQFSKQQILTLYCNLMNVANGNYGMEAAARSYFNKSVGELTLPEAATLAGILRRPALYDVYTNPEAVKGRRNVVLKRMREEGFISEEEYRAAADEPLLVAVHRRESEVGPYFAEEVRRYLANSYGTTALYDRGLEVDTTLDRTIQRAAETALRDGLAALDHRKGWRGPTQHLEDGALESHELPSWRDQAPVPGQWYEGIVLESGSRLARVKIADRVYPLTPEGIGWTRRTRPSELLHPGDVAWFRLDVPAAGGEPTVALEQEPEMEGAVVVLDSASGAVRALVGGWDYARNEFNRITQARRQVGSAFKPFVYGAALESGFTPADTLFDAPVVFAGADNQASYSPRNYYRRYYGITTLRYALEHSINVTSVKLLDMVGVERVIDFARRCGISEELPPYPSLALGSADISPLDLAAAYASFANQGIYVEPYLIEAVRSRDGRLLQEHLPRAHKAMEPQIAYVLTSLLQGVVARGTAAGGLAGVDLTMAGKTGTTNAYTDAWFVGYTPRYTILAWVGYDKKRSLGRGMTGAEAALPIWRGVVTRGIEDGWLDTAATFPEPPGVVEVEIDRDTGLRPGPGSGRTLREVFLQGTAPDQRYERRWGQILKLPWFLQEPFYLPKEGERMPRDIEDWSLVQRAWEDRG